MMDAKPFLKLIAMLWGLLHVLGDSVCVCEGKTTIAHWVSFLTHQLRWYCVTGVSLGIRKISLFQNQFNFVSSGHLSFQRLGFLTLNLKMLSPTYQYCQVSNYNRIYVKCIAQGLAHSKPPITELIKLAVSLVTHLQILNKLLRASIPFPPHSSLTKFIVKTTTTTKWLSTWYYILQYTLQTKLRNQQFSLGQTSKRISSINDS